MILQPLEGFANTLIVPLIVKEEGAGQLSSFAISRPVASAEIRAIDP